MHTLDSNVHRITHAAVYCFVGIYLVPVPIAPFMILHFSSRLCCGLSCALELSLFSNLHSLRVVIPVSNCSWLSVSLPTLYFLIISLPAYTASLGILGSTQRLYSLYPTQFISRQLGIILLPATMALPISVFVLTLTVYPRQASSLQVTPNSPCSSLCIDSNDLDISDPNSSNTVNDDITCYDTDFNATATGRKFQSCMTCLQDSSFSQGRESDQAWFLCKSYPCHVYHWLMTFSDLCGCRQSKIHLGLLYLWLSQCHKYCINPVLHINGLRRA